jgi:hypothetical protein
VIFFAARLMGGVGCLPAALLCWCAYDVGLSLLC